MSDSRLMVHAGGWLTPEPAIAQVSLPERTRSYTPIPHAEVLGALRGTLEALHLTEKRTQLALARDGKQLFGVMDLTNGDNAPDWGMAIGFRNSYDKSFALNCVAGSRVFVCDNLAFSGEVSMRERHVGDLDLNLSRLVGDLVERVLDRRDGLSKLIGRMKDRELSATEANDMLVRSVERGVIPGEQLLGVLREYRKPQHEEFLPRTAWSLYNAFTERAKDRSAAMQFTSTQRLTNLFEDVCS